MWKWCDGVLDAWKDDSMPMFSYPAGTWGPDEADSLIAKHKNSFWGYGLGEMIEHVFKIRGPSKLNGR